MLEKPVLLLNVHNRLHICVHLWKGLKKEYITTPVQNRQKIWAALKNMSQLLLASINHLELMYFSAFASPQEAEEYFRNRTQSEVSGDVVASQFFSHGELLNISLEMQSVIDAEIMLIEQDVYGEDVLLEADKKDYFLDTDIIIEAHRIIEFCVEGNISYDDLLLFLDGTDVVGFSLYSDLNEGVRAALSRMLRLNSLEWRYPVQRFFRREVLKILQRMSPSLYAPSVQAPFYVAELMKSSVTVRAWVGFFDEGIEEIMQLQQIGIMKLEPGKLNASDQAEFIDAIHGFREGSLTLEDLIVLMTKLQARIGRVV